MEDLSPASAACSRSLKPFIRFPALSCNNHRTVRTHPYKTKLSWRENAEQSACYLPPAPCQAGCDEAAAVSTAPGPRWPPALRTVQLSPGGTWPRPGPTARPSRRNGPLRGTAPSPGGPGQQGGDVGYVQKMKHTL